jgi:hypothetical protein
LLIPPPSFVLGRDRCCFKHARRAMAALLSCWPTMQVGPSRAVRPPLRSRVAAARFAPRRCLDLRSHRGRHQWRCQRREQPPPIVRVVRTTEDRGRRAREVAERPQAAPSRRQAAAQGASAARKRSPGWKHRDGTGSGGPGLAPGFVRWSRSLVSVCRGRGA